MEEHSWLLSAALVGFFSTSTVSACIVTGLALFFHQYKEIIKKVGLFPPNT